MSYLSLCIRASAAMDQGPYCKEQAAFYPGLKRREQERQRDQETISLEEPHPKELVCFLNMHRLSLAVLQALGLVQGEDPAVPSSDRAAGKIWVLSMRWCMGVKEGYKIKRDEGSGQDTETRGRKTQS